MLLSMEKNITFYKTRKQKNKTFGLVVTYTYHVLGNLYIKPRYFPVIPKNKILNTVAKKYKLF